MRGGTGERRPDLLQEGRESLVVGAGRKLVRVRIWVD